jgi:hypothetical protein
MLIEAHANAVVQDVPMKAKYGNEVSGLSTFKTFFEFLPNFLFAFLKRILLRYFYLNSTWHPYLSCLAFSLFVAVPSTV